LNVVPDGDESVNDTFAADAGPLFVTVTAYVAVEPGVTDAGPVLLTDRSAPVVGADAAGVTATIVPTHSATRVTIDRDRMRLISTPVARAGRRDMATVRAR
jgi:hypothetical protein